MVYARRTSRRPFRRPGRMVRKKGTGKGYSTYGLAKRVQGISKQLRINTRKIYWEQRFNRDVDNNPVEIMTLAPHSSVPIPSEDWAATFEAGTINQRKMQWKSFSMDCMVSCASFAEDVTYTAFLCSMTSVGNDLGIFGISGITNGVHFSTNDGMTMVNKKYFKIHRVRRFTVSAKALADNPGTENPGVKSSYYRWHWKLKFPKGRTLVNHDSAETVQDLEFHQLPYYNRFVFLLFNNEASIDEQQIKCNIIHSTDVPS